MILTIPIFLPYIYSGKIGEKQLKFNISKGMDEMMVPVNVSFATNSATKPSWSVTSQ